MFRGYSYYTPAIKLLNLIMTQAIRDGASDIHLEPDENSLRNPVLKGITTIEEVSRVTEQE
jgi:type II secretory ATPase GspE/PulE/Tfp pilus assembly ATPase PilB-like protein